MVSDSQWRIATVLRQGGSDPDHRDDIAQLTVEGADIVIQKGHANTWEIVIQTVDPDTGEVTRTIELNARYVGLWKDSDGGGGSYERMSEDRFAIWQKERDRALHDAAVAKEKAQSEAKQNGHKAEREPWWER